MRWSTSGFAGFPALAPTLAGCYSAVLVCRSLRGAWARLLTQFFLCHCPLGDPDLGEGVDASDGCGGEQLGNGSAFWWRH